MGGLKCLPCATRARQARWWRGSMSLRPSAGCPTVLSCLLVCRTHRRLKWPRRPAALSRQLADRTHRGLIWPRGTPSAVLVRSVVNVGRTHRELTWPRRPAVLSRQLADRTHRGLVVAPVDDVCSPRQLACWTHRGLTWPRRPAVLSVNWPTGHIAGSSWPRRPAAVVN